MKRIRVPSLLKPLASPIKAVIRALVYWRLSHRSLTIQQAEFWAEKMKDWPAIFVTPGFTILKGVAPGIFVQLGLVDVIERNLLVNGVWDEVVGRSLQALLKPGDTFLDIGANIGYFSLFASNLVGFEGRVFAVEPSRRALEKLLLNLRLNEANNVIVLSVAAGERTELGVLGLATPNNIGASSLRSTLNAVGFESVPVMRLDDVLIPLGLRPSVIKVDIEGGEFSALRGLERTLTEGNPFVLLELTDAFLVDSGDSALELISYMDGLGYKCYELSLGSRVKARAISVTLSEIPKHQAEVLFSRSEPDEFGIEVVDKAA